MKSLKEMDREIDEVEKQLLKEDQVLKQLYREGQEEKAFKQDSVVQDLYEKRANLIKERDFLAMELKKEDLEL